MLKLHFTGHSNWTNVYLTREGEKIGTELPHVSMCYDYPYYSLEIEADSMMMVVGDFLLFLSDRTHLSVGSTSGTVHLLYFEEEPKHYRTDKPDWLWPHEDLWTDFRSYKNLSSLISRIKELPTFNGAMYLPSNPINSSYQKSSFADQTSKGRWLFPHPDGSRAAYEHMQKTTLEDDLERLMPHFEEHPELMQTFSDLI